MARQKKTIEEQLDLFTTPIVKEEPKAEVIEPERVTVRQDNTPIMAIWDYEHGKFVDVPLCQWVEFQMINTNLPVEQLNAQFIKICKSKDTELSSGAGI